jgi:hypothetical protein
MVDKSEANTYAVGSQKQLQSKLNSERIMDVIVQLFFATMPII